MSCTADVHKKSRSGKRDKEYGAGPAFARAAVEPCYASHDQRNGSPCEARDCIIQPFRQG